MILAMKISHGRVSRVGCRFASNKNSKQDVKNSAEQPQSAMLFEISSLLTYLFYARRPCITVVLHIIRARLLQSDLSDLVARVSLTGRVQFFIPFWEGVLRGIDQDKRPKWLVDVLARLKPLYGAKRRGGR
jgi:hypothetical protein